VLAVNLSVLTNFDVVSVFKIFNMINLHSL
jgi:hypothetical protein